MNAGIRVRFSLRYPKAREAALDVDLNLPARGVTAIFGPSGAGKTSLLRCIAGLERARGELEVLGQVWQGPGLLLPTHRRPLGYVFQEASLFTHLTVRGNLRYAQQRAGAGAARWGDIVALMGLEGLFERYPHQLSGGERQRVAIGRALLIQPKLLLMDEPLASLDPARKQEIMPYLERLHAVLEIPVLYVSHSLDEVARLADRIVVLEGGRVRMEGPALDLLPQLHAPAGEEAGVVIEAAVVERDPRWKLARLQFDGAALWVSDDGGAMAPRLRARILARDVSLSRDAQARSSILNRLPARIDAIDDDLESPQVLVRLSVGETPLLARVTRRSVAELQLALGESVWAQIKSVAVIR